MENGNPAAVSFKPKARKHRIPANLEIQVRGFPAFTGIAPSSKDPGTFTVFLTNGANVGALPTALEGYSLKYEVVGQVRAL